MRPQRTPLKSKAKKQSKPESDVSDDEIEFQSPDFDDATDYGLEFTTSRITPRRHPSSTLRKIKPANQKKSQARDESSEESSYSEESPSPTTLPTKQLNQQKSVEMNRSSAKHPQTSQRTQPQSRVGKRKQAKPEHRAIKLDREILRLRSIDRFLIPRLPFSRVVRELLFEQSSTVHMITMGALEALQTSSELYLTQRFEDAYLLTKFRGRVTLEVRDMAVVAYFCRTYGNN
ncbi:hypothetical protein KR093_003773 [Drosophila rubida]|uniref:Core Histone H2A/H2B/H3 domain-containing protein n=1 Tax=Drosophila rubida TaxID=30044 RepID=A0AAD4PNV6_9MUSC|nr:hypothetical protein KR093_003773 [Drosophila rubida]